MAPNIEDAAIKRLYVCPSCHHPPGARFCYICGMGFPLSIQPKSEN